MFSMNNLIRTVLVLIAVALFGAGIGLGYRDLVAAEMATFTAGAVVLIFVFLSQFKRFKGLGIEAEMWEREMEEAQEIAEKFRNLATVVAKPLITNSMRLGRWSTGISRREMDNMVSEVKSILEKSGSRPEEIEAALEDYRRYTAFDMTRPAYSEVKKVLDEKVKEKQDVIDAYRGRVPADQNQVYNAAAGALSAARQSAKHVLEGFKITYADAYPETVRARVNECDLLTAQEKQNLLASLKDTIDDLVYFRETGKIRRPAVWFAEQDD